MTFDFLYLRLLPGIPVQVATQITLLVFRFMPFYNPMDSLVLYLMIFDTLNFLKALLAYSPSEIFVRFMTNLGYFQN